MRIPLHRTCACSLAIAAALATSGETKGDPKTLMVRALLDGRVIEGQPLRRNKAQMLLLGRDGRLYQFDPRRADSQWTNKRFHGCTTAQMQQDLYEEFGTTSDTTTTQHYIVVHPAGQTSEWADRFEQLYQSFNDYSRLHGFRPQEPPYPLVAIVFRSKADYHDYAAREGMTLQKRMLGHYSPHSNRIYLYDIRSDGGDWTTNADTILHEAAHQMAFNTGVHSRFVPVPRWLVEGLATMFEVRGVHDPRPSDTRKDRVNPIYLRDFNAFVTNSRPAGFMKDLIATDTPFRSHPQDAYAESWALTFFLVETQPRKYAEYLQRTASREIFTDYTAAERLADFQHIFHLDLKRFESQFLKFMEDYK